MLTPGTGWPNPRNDKQIVGPNWLLKINQHSSPIPTRKKSWMWSTKTNPNTCKYPKSQAQTSLIFPDIPKHNHQGAMAIETLQANSILDPPNFGAAIVGTRGQQRGIHVEGHGHHGALVAAQGQTTGTMLEGPRSKSTREVAVEPTNINGSCSEINGLWMVSGFQALSKHHGFNNGLKALPTEIWWL